MTDETKARAMIDDAAHIFEEMADSFEAMAKTMRAVVVLSGAKADVLTMLPHMTTAMKLYTDLAGMNDRVNDWKRKHGLG